MGTISKTQKTESRIFRLVLLLLFASFFEESGFNAISTIALFSMLLLPVVILVWLVFSQIKVTREEKRFIAVFILFMCTQLIGIRWDALYTSITPIYRSFTVLMIVLYVRRIQLNNDKIRALIFLTFATFIVGIATIFSPNDKGQNILIGNYNTVGALYFTLFVINFLIYLRKRKIFAMLNCICCGSMILISNTRTALFLLIIMFGIWFILNIMGEIGKSITKPKIIYPLLFLIIVGFIWFYYNIKDLSIYTQLNQISQKLFHKNFDSGRADLWHLTVDAVGSNWFLGCGTGIDLENFFWYVKTPHSVYFDIYLQNGLFGVITYFLCIIYVIKAKGKWKKTSFNMLLMSIVFVILFYNSVGIVFTKARSGIGLLQWALIAIPYMTVKEKLTARSMIYDKPDCASLQRKTVS